MGTLIEALYRDENTVVVDADSTGATNVTAAFVAAAAKIQADGGGYLKVPPGEYLVGQQTFANGAGLGYAYLRVNIIEIHDCPKPVVIDLRGVKLKTAPGLKFGAFSATTGNAVSPTLPYTGENSAGIGQMIDVRGNVSVEILGPFELDGNITNAVIGGQWGDTGWQTQHTGIIAYSNKSFAIRGGAHIHHFGLDGLTIGWPSLPTGADLYPHAVDGLRSLYNGRQGLSLVGGNRVHVSNSDFSHTGRNGVVASNPCAGVDIENEGGGDLIRNVRFVNCRFHNNVGSSVLEDLATSRDVLFEDCLITGETNYAVWCISKAVMFRRCTIVGQVLVLHAAVDRRDAARFEDCFITANPAESPLGIVFGGGGSNFSSGLFGMFERCTLDNQAAQLPRMCEVAGKQSIISNCVLKSTNAGSNYLGGILVGHNVVTCSGTLDTSAAVNYGHLIINGVAQAVSSP